MSNALTNLCCKLVMSPPQKSVLMCLADRANDSCICWPSLPGICEWTCLGRTAVIAAIRGLESAGLITITKVSGKNNHFTVNPSARRTGPPDAPVRETHPTSPSPAPPPVRQTHHTRPPDAPEPSIHHSIIKESPKKTRANPSGSTPNKAKAGKASKRVPDDFTITEAMVTWAADKAPHANIERETEQFRDWEFARARTDWPAAWRTWMRKASDDALKRHGTSGAPTGETVWQRSQRERVAEATGGTVSRRAPRQGDFIDGETAWQRGRRDRVAEMTGGRGDRKPLAPFDREVIDADPKPADVIGLDLEPKRRE